MFARLFIFLLILLLLCPTHSDNSCLHSHLFPRIIWFFSLVSSLTHLLFNSDLFNFKVLKFFLFFYNSLLVSVHDNLKKVVNIICIFLILWSYVLVAQHVVYLGECSMYFGKKCLFRFLRIESPNNPFSSISSFRSTVSLLSYSLVDISMGCQGGVEVSH